MIVLTFFSPVEYCLRRILVIIDRLSSLRRVGSEWMSGLDVGCDKYSTHVLQGSTHNAGLE